MSSDSVYKGSFYMKSRHFAKRIISLHFNRNGYILFFRQWFFCFSVSTLCRTFTCILFFFYTIHSVKYCKHL